MTLLLATLVNLLTPKRRWFQFSLLTMFLVVTAFGVWLGHWVDPVSKLCRQLHDPSKDVRAEAATRLGQMGSKARAAESSLVGAFEDESPEVQCMAALAISQIGGDWRVLVPLLDADADEAAVRLSAAQAIVRSGGNARLVVGKLLEYEAQDGNLAAVLPSFGPDPTLAAIPVLIEAVAGHDAALKTTANELLRERLPVPPLSAVPVLTEYLADSSADVRIAAAEQLLRLGTDARQASHALRQRLDAPDRRVRLAIAAALVAVDSADGELLAVLIESLHPDDKELRDLALYYCEQLGPRAAGVVGELVTLFDENPNDEWYEFKKVWKGGKTPSSLPERIGPASLPLLKKILSHGRPHARLRAAMQLANLGRRVCCQVPELVGVLTSLLDDLDENEQRQVVWALGEIGKDAEPAVPRLVKLIKSDTEFKRRYIKYDSMVALRKIGELDETTRAELTATLVGSSQVDRRLAAQMLAAGGVAAEVVLPTLIELAQDDPEMVADLLEFLGDCRLGSAAAPATDFVVAELTEPLPTDYDREYYARAVLVEIGPAAVGKLIEVLDHPRPRTRALAAKALGEIGPAANGAVPRLIGLLDDRTGADRVGDRSDFWDDDWLPIGFDELTPIGVRDFAITALGKIGPESRPAVPRLVRLLEEPLHQETDHAHHRALLTAWTLGQIGPDASPAVPALIRLAKHNQEPPGATAAVALARIDPQNPAVIECLKWYLAVGERRGFYTSNGWATPIFEDYHNWEEVLTRILDVVRELGLQAEPLVSDLRRLLASPLRHLDTRCRAAFALASLPAERPAAVRYLERIAARGHDNEYNEADRFLEEIEASDHRDR